jgi:hypothetical protein
MQKRSIVILVLVPLVLALFSFPTPSHACLVRTSLWKMVMEADLMRPARAGDSFRRTGGRSGVTAPARFPGVTLPT